MLYIKRKNIVEKTKTRKNAKALWRKDEERRNEGRRKVGREERRRKK